MNQVWDAASYARDARFVSDLGEDILALLAPRPGERILDLGCGDGALTERIAQSGAHVVGVDTALAFVDATRARGLDARLGDGTALGFHRDFDAVFSNAAIHWMRDADAVIASISRALVPGGRFVGEFGGHGNCAAIRTAVAAALAARGIDASARSPWYFPTSTQYRAKLEAGGFIVDAIALVPRPTKLPGAIDDWIALFMQSHLAGLDEEKRAGVVRESVTLLRPILYTEGAWTADYVRLRVAARRA
jgi:SAM-dependent methyltransferase